MEARYGNEPTMASDNSRDVPVLGILPLQSPPRIQRLPNRQQKTSVEDSDSENYSMHFPLTMTTPPRPPSGNNCDVTEYRRRLEVLKERRARHTNRSETMSEPILREDQSMDYYSTTHEQHYYMPETLEKPFPSSIEITPTNKPSARLNDSPVSTCQTLDEIALNRNTTIGSTNICVTSQQQEQQQQQQTHRSPSSRTNTTERRGCAMTDTCASNDYLNLRHLMCKSSEQDIDTGFAQITDVLCQTKHENEKDTTWQYYEAMNDDEIHRGQSCLGAGTFPEPVTYRSVAPMKDRQNGLLDRLLCSNALSTTPKRTKQSYSSSNPSKRLVSSLPFRGSNQQSYESEYEDFQDGFPVDRTRSIPSRGGSSFSWVRKDPWYLTSNFTEGSFEEMMIEDGKLDNKVMDHVMHAVVFVKGEAN